jgi:hypothetical protein
MNLEVKSTGQKWQEVCMIIVKGILLDKFNEREDGEWRKIKR